MPHDTEGLNASLFAMPCHAILPVCGHRRTFVYSLQDPLGVGVDAYRASNPMTSNGRRRRQR
jgi:hypothetical protein